MHLDPAIHVMICSRCFHINEITNPVCSGDLAQQAAILERLKVIRASCAE